MPTHCSFGDLNGDGFPDVASVMAEQNATLTPAYVTVCMNLGGGVFGPPTLYSAGRECCAVEMGDFNRDGRLDLAVTNAMDDTVSILPNLGDGRFGPATNYAVGRQPRSLKIADLNADGLPDIAVLNCLSNDVSILFGRPDGTFSPEVRIPVGNVTQRGDPNTAFPYPGPFLAIADFNGDHAPDIAIPCPTRVKLLLNDGHGGFALSPTPAPILAHDAYCIGVGDLNHDGTQDMVVAVTASGDDGLQVLLGRGDGTFASAAAYNADPEDNFVFINHVDLGDLDGDGNLDVAVGAEQCWGKITYFRGRGDGTLFPKQFVTGSSARSWYVGLVDLTRGGKPDLAVLTPPRIGNSRSTLRIHLNDGTGTPIGYSISHLTAPGSSVDSYAGAAFGDIDGDGLPDLALTVDNADYQVSICRNVGGGHFQFDSTISYGTYPDFMGHWTGLADLNHDGRADLIVTDGANFQRPGHVYVALNTGGMSFAPPTIYPLGQAFANNVVAADLNGDGWPDLAVWSEQPYPGGGRPLLQRYVQVMFNRGDGTFDPPIMYPVGSWYFSAFGAVAAADLDGDGHPDLIALEGPDTAAAGAVVTLHNRGDGTFEPWASMQVTAIPHLVEAADVNGDGKLDVVVLHNNSYGSAMGQPYLTILYNDGTGAFPTRSVFSDPQILAEYALTLGDFNGDGKPDIAFSENATGSPAVMLNRGDGTFGRPVLYTASTRVSGWPTGLAAGDFDHSGRTGLVSVQDVDYASYLPNTACQSCYANCDGSTVAPTLNVGDFLCFLQLFSAHDPRANCDDILTAWGAPALNVNDFMCFLTKYARGCP